MLDCEFALNVFWTDMFFVFQNAPQNDPTSSSILGPVCWHEVVFQQAKQIE